MNAGSLWAGTEYAWAEYRPRGSFSMAAVKVKLIKVQKVRRGYNSNMSTVAEVEVLEGRYQGRTLQVKARDIVNFWNEYEDERDHRRNEAQKREAERRERVEAMYKSQREQEQKEADENQKIADALEQRGIDKAAIKGIGSSSITLDRVTMISWLGIDAQ
jgi:hypothetical protein